MLICIISIIDTDPNKPKIISYVISGVITTIRRTIFIKSSHTSISASDVGGTTMMLLGCQAFFFIEWVEGRLEVIKLILLVWNKGEEPLGNMLINNGVDPTLKDYFWSLGETIEGATWTSDDGNHGEWWEVGWTNWDPSLDLLSISDSTNTIPSVFPPYLSC